MEIARSKSGSTTSSMSCSSASARSSRRSTSPKRCRRQRANREYERLWQTDVRRAGRRDRGRDRRGRGPDVGPRAAPHASWSESALLARYEPILGKIQPLAKQIVVTGAFDTVALLVERRYKAGLEPLKAELDTLTEHQCEIVSTDVDEDTTAAIVVYAKQYAEPVHKFLAMENVNQIRLPSDFQDMPIDVAYEEIKHASVRASRTSSTRSATSSPSCRASGTLRLVDGPRRAHGPDRRDQWRFRSSVAPSTRS